MGNFIIEFLKKYFYIIFLCSFILFFYFSFIFGKSFVWEDGLYIFYSGANYFATTLRDGRFPFWINGLRLGMPFYSDTQMGVYYPLNLLLSIFVKNGELPFLIYQIFIVFHLFLAGIFMYLLLLKFKIDKIFALLGSIIFIFSGYFSLHIIHVSFFQVVVWVPLVLFFILKRFEKEDFKVYLYIILSILLTFLPGGPQISLYFSYFFIFFWLFLFFINHYKKENKKNFVKKLVFEFFKIAGVYIAVLLIGAVFFIPSILNWYHSVRQNFGFKEISDQSLPYFHLLQFFAANFFGFVNGPENNIPFWGYNKDTIEYQTWHAGAWQYWEFGFYAGQIVLISIFILIFNWKKIKEEKTYLLFFIISSILALWIMLGRYGGLFNILYYIAPGFSLFRTPARMACVLDFSLAIFSAIVMNFVFKTKDLELKRPFILNLILYISLIVFVFLFGASIFSELIDDKNFKNSLVQLLQGLIISVILWLLILLSVKRRYNLFMFFLIIVVYFDLFVSYSHFHKGTISPEKYYSDRNNLIFQLKNLRNQIGPFRFAQLRGGKISEELIFPRNIAYFYKDFEVLEGYVLYYLKDIIKMNEINDSSRLDLFNVRVVANYDPQNNNLGIFLYTNSLPRGYFYSSVKIFEKDDDIIKAINSRELNYFKDIAVLSKYIKQNNFSNISTNKEIKVLYLSPEKIEIEYDVPSSGIIFVSQTYFPGWKTEGKNFDVIPVFVGLTGIVLPEAGKGKFYLVFKPDVFYYSLAISLISFSVFVIILILLKIRKINLKKDIL